MALGPTQPIREMSTRNLPGIKERPSRKATTAHPSVIRLSKENVGVSTSHKPMGLHGLSGIALPFLPFYLVSFFLDYIN
jgi:hypothetical protein